MSGDEDYLNWLRLYHPEPSLVNCNNESLCQTADVELNGLSDISLTQYFSNVSPLSAVASNFRSPQFQCSCFCFL